MWHETMRVNLNDMKHNGMMNILIRHLGQLQPESESKQQLLPCFEILVGGQHEVKFHLKKTQQYIPRKDIDGQKVKLLELLELVKMFKCIKEKGDEGRHNDFSNEPLVKGVMEGIGFQLQNCRDSLSMDLKVLERMSFALTCGHQIKIWRSEYQVTMVDLLRSK